MKFLKSFHILSTAILKERGKNEHLAYSHEKKNTLHVKIIDRVGTYSLYSMSTVMAKTNVQRCLFFFLSRRAVVTIPPFTPHYTYQTLPMKISYQSVSHCSYPNLSYQTFKTDYSPEQF